MLDSRLIQVMPAVGARYNAPNRHYHNWSHIAAIFALVEKHKLNLTLAQQAAVIFHDIVYVPGAGNNELESVYAMDYFIGDTFPNDVLIEAGQIIMDTRTHKPSIASSSTVLDLDMAILGNKKTHAEYDRAIREEFRQYPDKEYYAGRKMFCEATLALPNIYWTAEFHDAYDKNAREYLKNTIHFCEAILHGPKV